jgi:iron complex outermembrane receptor protein
MTYDHLARRAGRGLAATLLCAGQASAQQEAAARADDDVARVVVSARKRDETLIELPQSISNLSERSLRDYRIGSFVDYASRIPNLSFAFGNGASAGNPATAISDARTIALRGVAGARTTGFYLDDTPLPGALDVRIVDVHNIEVLRGPQGTLYGESSLGGNIRIVSKAPDLQANTQRIGLGWGPASAAGGQTSNTLEGGANIVLAPGVAALRLAAFSEREGGYLSRNYLSDIEQPASPRIRVGNQGALRTEAASVTARLRPHSALELSLRLMYQHQRRHGFPAADAPLPAFVPLTTQERRANVQPEAGDRWRMAALSLAYRGKDWTLNSSTSLFTRRTRDLEDSTEGTAQYWGSTLAQPYAWTALHASRQVAHETRLNLRPGQALSAIVGLFHSRLQADFDILPIYGQLGERPGSPTLLWRQNDVNEQRNTAVFGELYYQLSERLGLTAGTRKYWLRQRDKLQFAYQTTLLDSDNANASSGYSPKLALAYRAADTSLLYASAAKGFRQGNAQLDVSGFGCDASLAAIGQTPRSISQIAPDSVWSYEAGAKLELPEPGLLLTAAAFHIRWDNIQQPIFLPSCGFYLQGNAGAAAIDGAEFELAGRVNGALKIHAGLGYTRARITAAGNTGQPPGTPVYQVPRLTASLGGMWRFALGAHTQGFVVADLSHTGASVSANSGADLHLRRAGYTLLAIRVGATRGRSEWSLHVRNVGNARPNLGDIGYIGYQRFAEDGKTPIPQVATMAPRNIALLYRYGF